MDNSAAPARSRGSTTTGHPYKSHHRPARGPGRLGRALLLAALLTLALNLKQVSCAAQVEEPEHAAELSSLGRVEPDGPELVGASEPDTGDGEQPPLQGEPRDDSARLSTRLPRQHFRLKVGPTSRKASPFRLVTIRRRASQQAGGRRQRGTRQPDTKTAGAPGEQLVVSVEIKQGELIVNNQTQPRPQRGAGKKISSAALKRLLVHTLPRLESAGATDHNQQGPGNGPNFKFVFIQRATKAPNLNASSGADRKPGTGTRQPQFFHHLQAPAPPQQQQSLAASVSRQLASSLFYSTANLMNFNNSGPANNLITSLSALAALSGAGKPSAPESHQSSADNELAQPAGAKAPAAIEATNHIDKDEPAGAESGPLDIRRLSRPTTSSASDAAGQQPPAAGKTKPKKSRPSKIYNLPVKFVSNGQPNSVMFHTLKQHFATIKKLQQQTAAAGSTRPAGSEPGKARPKKPLGPSRLKGTNSRLIYLPLKYLSNAKPTMLSSIMSAGGANKASHKSSPAGTKLH